MRARAGAVRFGARLTPRAGGDGVDGVVDGVLRVRVAAPPIDGAANEALTRLIAAELGLPRSAVRLAGGARNRRKWIELDGVEPAALRARWPGLDV
jgi:hypothetical protein